MNRNRIDLLRVLLRVERKSNLYEKEIVIRARNDLALDHLNRHLVDDESVSEDVISGLLHLFSSAENAIDQLEEKSKKG
jgi:hypothetical protein